MTPPPPVPPGPSVEAVDFGVRRGGSVLLEGITLRIPRTGVTAIIGPTHSGKSLFLRCLNRMCELEGTVQTSGTLRVLGQDVYAPGVDVAALRRKVGLIFSLPALPVAGIFDNVAMAPRLTGLHDRALLAQIAERCLRQVDLWEALRECLGEPAAGLSPEQRQRLCIARVLAAEPEILLFDEPTAHLDYPSATRLQDLICALGERRPILVAAQTPQQASHMADTTAFFSGGKLIEVGPTAAVLLNPQDPRTEAYVTGRGE